ncbi:hypothetical protein [Candidatus Liberibacter sp.]|uniref:hypothetical protein n=1 Tax=Candidatus Liberibacter sp. TaxID=34022 RepID=UPI0015F75DD9|nr:hypothetical protein [Candidatus Liberibacter sp.]MBA5723811.1 hypothetical protein [Candidatus Liberibacter sp.]
MILKKIRVKTEKYFPPEDSGGTLLTIDDNKPSKETIHSLDKALQNIFNIHTISSEMPLGHPAEKKHITSFLVNTSILLLKSLQYMQE